MIESHHIPEQQPPSRHVSKWLSRFCGAVLCLALPLSCIANDEVEIRIKTAFLYNYARFIEWPDADMQKPIVIAVLGQNDLRATLEETVRGKTANGRHIQVHTVAAITEAEQFQILLVERSESRKMKDIVRAVAGRPVLTVCDFDNCLRDGGMIAFRLVDETVRFEVNLEAAERAGLKISSQLLKVALPTAARRK